MAVEPKLSDQEIARLMEISYPSRRIGASNCLATRGFPDIGSDAMIEYARKGAIINTTWMV